MTQQVFLLGTSNHTFYYYFNSFDSTGKLAALSKTTGAVTLNGGNSFITFGSSLSTSIAALSGANLYTLNVDSSALGLAANDQGAAWLSYGSLDVFDIRPTKLFDFVALTDALTSGESTSVSNAVANTLSTSGVSAVPAPGDYSSVVTVGIGIATPSTVTVQVSANADKTGYGLAAGAYSGATVDVRQVQTVLDKTGYALSSAGNTAAAASLLSTNLGNTHYVQEALFALRNKVDVSGSVMTVYQPDDITSSWTASITTGTITLTSVAPTP